ncbi:MAG: FHA domain-containing protein [Betaproteobacteria bacterium]|nr:FHA domain-containing protein [Betaproteobacteria bacterium]
MSDASISWQAWVENRQGEKTPVRGSCSLGRAPANHIVIPDTRVSRRHATIQLQGEGEYWLVDFGSSNGTYLNGARITQPTRLHSDDVLQMGGADEFVFRQASVTAEAAPAANFSDRTIFDVRQVQCWLLVADIINSTHLVNELAPDELPLVTGGWLRECREIIEATGGRINQFMGDGFFAYWRDGPAMDTEILRSIQALHGLQSQAKPAFRFVLHLAPVVFGGVAIGEEERISGSEVHYVFRMEKLAGKLKVPDLISAPVWDRLSGAVQARDMGRHPLQGFTEDFSFFSLTAGPAGV